MTDNPYEAPTRERATPKPKQFPLSTVLVLVAIVFVVIGFLNVRGSTSSKVTLVPPPPAAPVAQEAPPEDLSTDRGPMQVDDGWVDSDEPLR